jgi:hypothetical protein
VPFKESAVHLQERNRAWLINFGNLIQIKQRRIAKGLIVQASKCKRFEAASR